MKIIIILLITLFMYYVAYRMGVSQGRIEERERLMEDDETRARG